MRLRSGIAAAVLGAGALMGIVPTAQASPVVVKATLYYNDDGMTKVVGGYQHSCTTGSLEQWGVRTHHYEVDTINCKQGVLVTVLCYVGNDTEGVESVPCASFPGYLDPGF